MVQQTITQVAIDDLVKYMDYQQKLDEYNLSLKRLTDRLEVGKIKGSEPYTDAKALSSIKVIEEYRDEVIEMMDEVYTRLEKAYLPKSVDLGEMWISAGRGFYFKLKDKKVVIADGTINQN